MLSFSAFGGTTSIKTRENTRFTDGFESFSDAVDRTAKDNEKIERGLKRKRDHVGHLENYSCEWDNLYEKVSDGKVLKHFNFFRTRVSKCIKPPDPKIDSILISYHLE